MTQTFEVYAPILYFLLDLEKINFMHGVVILTSI